MTYQLPATTGDDLGHDLKDPKIGLKRDTRAGMIVIATFLFGVIALSTFIKTSGAVIGVGEVTVESRVKKIAHPTGGVIAELFVREGSIVKEGDPLMRLDDTVSGMSAAASGDSVEQLLANAARLQAERDGVGKISFPAALTQNATPDKLRAMAEAQRLFVLRRQSLMQEQAQVGERIRQTEQEISALSAQKDAIDRQSALVQPELEGLRSLRERGLVTVNRLNMMERTVVELQGTAAVLNAQMAQARARIAELRQSAIQMTQTFRLQAGAEVLDVKTRLNDQKIRSASASDAFNRSLVVAPSSGVVNQLYYSTMGGVVPPMETILEIVPTNDALQVSAQVSPADIDQISLGQGARVRFSAFSAATTPEVRGTLSNISAERITNERTGMSYYKVTIDVQPEELSRLGNIKLVPGMPAEVFIEGASRSLISYITKPLRDQFSRAFRENN